MDNCGIIWMLIKKKNEVAKEKNEEKKNERTGIFEERKVIYISKDTSNRMEILLVNKFRNMSLRVIIRSNSNMSLKQARTIIFY